MKFSKIALAVAAIVSGNAALAITANNYTKLNKESKRMVHKMY